MKVQRCKEPGRESGWRGVSVARREAQHREGPERRRALHRPSGPESPQAEPSRMHVECYREDPEGLS